MFAQRATWPTVANALSTALERHRAAGRHLLDLTETNPARAGLAFPEAPALLAALAEPAALAYAPEPFGNPVARDILADWLASRGLTIDAAQLCLTASTSEAYGFLFKLLCDPGDAVLVPSPSYPLFDDLAKLDGVRAVPYPLRYDGDWHVDLGAVDAALAREPRAKALIAIHPNNPTGNYLKPGELDALAQRCAARNLALISDEVFYEHRIAHWLLIAEQHRTPGGSGLRTGAPLARAAPVQSPAPPEVPIGKPAAVPPSAPITPPIAPRAATRSDCLAFSLGGLSKLAGLPQIKLGWIAVGGPAALRDDALARLEHIADTYLSASTPAQLALPIALAHADAFVRAVGERLHRNLTALDDALAAAPSATRLRCEGGWTAIVRLPSTRSDEAWALHLLETASVLVQPGYFYDLGAPGTYVVVSLLTDPATFSAGASGLAGAVAGAEIG